MKKFLTKQRMQDKEPNVASSSGKKLIKYNPKWKETYKWVEKSEKGDNYTFCTICSNDLYTASMGQTALTRHNDSTVHNSWETVSMIVLEGKKPTKKADSTPKVWDFTCLVCLKECKSYSISIFEKDDSHMTIADKISECTGIKVHDIIKNMTEEICTDCYSNLNIAYEFRKSCHSSLETLKNSDYKYDFEETKSSSSAGKNLKIERKSPDNLEKEENVGGEESFEITKFEEELHTVEYIESDINFNDDDSNGNDMTNIITADDGFDINFDSEIETEANNEDEGETDYYFFESKSENKEKKRSTTPPPLICEICGNKCKNKSTLKDHMRRHLKDKPYKCEFCEKSFVVSFELDRHMRVHTREKPHACQYCGRKFSDLSTRNRHERTHTGERPYGCEICGKHFTYAHTLKRHYDVHTGIKKFQCDVCSKGFTKKLYLSDHLKKHHNIISIKLTQQ